MVIQNTRSNGQVVREVTTIICFFCPVNFRQKNYNFRTDQLQDENNFTSRVWCALLIEEIALRAEDMAYEKEIACCVRGYHVHKDIWAAAIGEVLKCSRDREPTNVEKFSLQKNIFALNENIFTTK